MVEWFLTNLFEMSMWILLRFSLNYCHLYGIVDGAVHYGVNMD